MCLIHQPSITLRHSEWVHLNGYAWNSHGLIWNPAFPKSCVKWSPANRLYVNQMFNSHKFGLMIFCIGSSSFDSVEVINSMLSSFRFQLNLLKMLKRSISDVLSFGTAAQRTFFNKFSTQFPILFSILFCCWTNKRL